MREKSGVKTLMGLNSCPRCDKNLFFNFYWSKLLPWLLSSSMSFSYSFSDMTLVGTNGQSHNCQSTHSSLDIVVLLMVVVNSITVQ